MGNKLHSSQIQTGISPGDIPVYTNNSTLISSGYPIDQFDVINKRYLDEQISNITTPLSDHQSSNINDIIDSVKNLKLYVDNNYANIVTTSNSLSEQCIKYNNLNDIKLLELENAHKFLINSIEKLKDYINNKTQDIYVELSTLVTTLRDDNNVVHSVTIEKTLDELKQEYKSKIDQYCANFLNYEVVYKEKFEQAVDFIMQPTPEIDSFPLLVLDTTIYNISIQEAAERIIQKRKQWLHYMTQIEKLRLTTKLNIDSIIEKEYINDLYLDFEQNIQLLTNG